MSKKWNLTGLNITTLKGQYGRGEAFSLRIEGLPEGAVGRLRFRIMYLAETVYEEIKPLPAGRPSLFRLTPAEEHLPAGVRGLGCSCELLEGDDVIACGQTAFDIADPDRPVIRYGFLCDFGPGDGDQSEDSLNFLASIHATHVQFYDWTFRPHDYRGTSTVYYDTMGKEIDFGLVQREIKGCRERGMKALGYGAVYAAGEKYLEIHPDQSLRDADGVPYNLIDRFFIMDIRPGSLWRKNLMDQYRYAVKEAGFDGIHMDTYGFPKRAFASGGKAASGRTGAGELVYLEDDFFGLIAESRELLGGDASLIFNNVGNWPVEATGSAPQDAVYIEVWEPSDSYAHIRRIILDASVHRKPVILAAYLAPFRLEENHGGVRSLMAALILQAAIVSLGASHLLLGESGKALTQGYYNDYSELRSDEMDRLRPFLDFQVRYTDLFYDESLVEISETHTAGENREYFFSGAPVSADGRAGTVWALVRENRRMKVISLINLTGQNESYWNRGKETPAQIEKFVIDFPMDSAGRACRVLFASPDKNYGDLQEIPVERIRNERGAAGRVTLTELSLWSVLLIQ